MLKTDNSVYLLAGSEEFLKQEQLAKFKAAFLEEQSASFNFNVFYPTRGPSLRAKSDISGKGDESADSGSLKKIMECAHTLPFLGSKRLVVVHQIEALSASDKKLLVSHLNNTPKSTCLVLETAQTNLKQNFFKEICKFAKVILCQPLQAGELAIWVNRQVKLRGKKIEQRAQRLILENLGNNLQLLSQAFDSLSVYVGQRETIAAADVGQLVGPDVAASVFSLFDALLARDTLKTWQILDSLLKDGVNSAQILGALTYQIISARDSLSPGQFADCFRQLQGADADIKTGRCSQRLALELLLVGLSELF